MPSYPCLSLDLAHSCKPALIRPCFPPHPLHSPLHHPLHTSTSSDVLCAMYAIVQPSAHDGEQWVQLDFGERRYVDMLHLWGYNAAEAAAEGPRPSPRAVVALEVQVPDANGGWVTVGSLDALPPPSLDGRDAGLHVRSHGVPLYQVHSIVLCIVQ
jgi:hypothetical protein